MSSYEFEVAAKNALIRVLEEQFDIMVSIKDLHFVWFGYVLGNMKCLIFGREMNSMYAEVTWHKENQAMYVDIYKKIAHTGFPANELNLSAKI